MSKSADCNVNTSFGKVQGSYENGLYVFKGIPYAAPPVGELRWMPPAPHQPWDGVRPAVEFGAIAPQLPMSPLPGKEREEEPQSESCLFLNIWTPGLDDARRPVMVWIHGGAFSIGSGSETMYRGGKLAATGDIVLVTVNYRLGVLGFLNLNELTRGRIPATGNEGLLDQVAALKWVRDNIAAFGGDPGNVTIFGESAGAMSVACLMNMPAARGLFHKAILESPVGEIARPLVPSLRIAEEFLKIVGIRPQNDSALRALPVDTLLAAQQELAVRTGQGMAPAIPVADGRVLPWMPLESYDVGLAARVPTLVGSNLDEQKLFSMMQPESMNMDENDLQAVAREYTPQGNSEKLLRVYRSAREKRGESTAPFEMFSAMNTDLLFRRVAIRIAEAQCKHASAGYNYLFTWKSPAAGGALGACHALEIGFIFGNYDPLFCGSGPEADRLSRQMQDAWLSFARTGNPSCESLGDWPPYSEERYTMRLDKECGIIQAAYEEERRVWDEIGPVRTDRML